MSFTDVISTTRSIRRIKPDPVPAEMLERVLQAAVWAPSGGNRQPWRMIVVQDPQTKKKLRDLYVDEWDVYVTFNMNNVKNSPEEVQKATAAALAPGTAMADTLDQIPVIVMFVHDSRLIYVTDDKLGRTSVVGGASLYPAVQNLLTAARAEGLGGVLTTLICRREPEVQQALGLPKEWAVHAMVPLGFPKGNHGPLTRMPLSQMVHYDRWSS